MVADVGWRWVMGAYASQEAKYVPTFLNSNFYWQLLATIDNYRQLRSIESRGYSTLHCQELHCPD
jgi:hypothetical protein